MVGASGSSYLSRRKQKHRHLRGRANCESSGEIVLATALGGIPSSCVWNAGAAARWNWSLWGGLLSRRAANTGNRSALRTGRTTARRAAADPRPGLAYHPHRRWDWTRCVARTDSLDGSIPRRAESHGPADIRWGIGAVAIRRGFRLLSAGSARFSCRSHDGAALRMTVRSESWLGRRTSNPQHLL